MTIAKMAVTKTIVVKTTVVKMTVVEMTVVEMTIVEMTIVEMTIVEILANLKTLTPRMKNLFRQCLSVLGVGTTVWGTALFLANPALSLTASEVAEKLGGIPVFTIGLLEGNQVTFLEEPIRTNDGQEVQISRIYLNPEDAEADLAQIKNDNPSLPEGVEVARISLGEVFCISQQDQAQPCEQITPQTVNPPEFIYFPDRNQLNSAIELLRSQGTEIGEDTPLFVPLFFTRIQLPEQQPRTVPVVYFSIQNLQQDITEAKEATPELSEAQFEIQVTTLNRVIEQMITEENGGMEQIRFIP